MTSEGKKKEEGSIVNETTTKKSHLYFIPSRFSRKESEREIEKNKLYLRWS